MAKTKGKKRGTKGRKVVEDKKTMVGCYILESKVAALGGKPQAREVGAKLLNLEADRLAKKAKPN